MMRMSVDLSKLEPNMKKRKEKMQVILDEQVVKDSNYFVPRDTGILEQNALSSREKGKAIWDTPYARRLYWNPQYDFSTDSNPNARGLWFEEAKSMFLSDWVKILEKVK